MTGDGSFFPEPPSTQRSPHNAKSIFNYHPVLEFNGNNNDFWLLFDDSDMLEKHHSKPLRKPQKPKDGIAMRVAPSKPGFSNTFIDATSSKSGFLRPKDDDEELMQKESPKRKYDDRDRKRSRSHDRRWPNSRKRRRSRSMERHRSRSPDGKQSPRRDPYSRRRSKSRERRGKDRSRIRDRLPRSSDRDRKRMSPSRGCSKRSESISSSSSISDCKSETNRDNKAEILKKFAEKLQEKASTSTAKKSLSSVRLSSRLEDTKHRRAEVVTPIVFSLKKAPVKSFPATTLPQKTEDKKTAVVKEKSPVPTEVSKPSALVLSAPTLPVSTGRPPPLKSLASQVPPPLIAESVSQPAEPLRVSDGVTVACAPTLYKDGKKALVKSTALALPPSVKPMPTILSQPTPTISQLSSVMSQSQAMMSQAMEAPVVSEMHQTLVAQALEYAAIGQAQEPILQGQMTQLSFDQQNMGMPPPSIGHMRAPPGPPPGLPRTAHGIRPRMVGLSPGMTEPQHLRPLGQFMGPYSPDVPFIRSLPPHGPDGLFLSSPPPLGPEGPFMPGPPPHVGGCFMHGPPQHGPEGPFMRPPPHGPERPFMGHPSHRLEGPFMRPPPLGPEGPFMGPPPLRPEGPFMGPPLHADSGPFMGPPGPGMRPPFIGLQCGPRRPSNQTVTVSSQNTNPVSRQGKNLTSTPQVEAKTSSSSSSKPSPSAKEIVTTPIISGKPKPPCSYAGTKSTDMPRGKGGTPPEPISTLDIPNFKKILFVVELIAFLQYKSNLKEQITALKEKGSSDEFCIKNSLLCKVKKGPEGCILVIMVPEDGIARRVLVTAFALKYPELDVEALIELFEQTFHNMPVEDIEDVFEDESTRSSKLLKFTELDFTKVESISSCGSVVLCGEKSQRLEHSVKLETPESAATVIPENAESAASVKVEPPKPNIAPNKSRTCKPSYVPEKLVGTYDTAESHIAHAGKSEEAGASNEPASPSVSFESTGCPDKGVESSDASETSKLKATSTPDVQTIAPAGERLGTSSAAEISRSETEDVVEESKQGIKEQVQASFLTEKGTYEKSGVTNRVESVFTEFTSHESSDSGKEFDRFSIQSNSVEASDAAVLPELGDKDVQESKYKASKCADVSKPKDPKTGAETSENVVESKFAEENGVAQPSQPESFDVMCPSSDSQKPELLASMEERSEKSFLEPASNRSTQSGGIPETVMETEGIQEADGKCSETKAYSSKEVTGEELSDKNVDLKVSEMMSSQREVDSSPEVTIKKEAYDVETRDVSQNMPMPNDVVASDSPTYGPEIAPAVGLAITEIPMTFGLDQPQTGITELVSEANESQAIGDTKTVASLEVDTAVSTAVPGTQSTKPLKVEPSFESTASEEIKNIQSKAEFELAKQSEPCSPLSEVDRKDNAGGAPEAANSAAGTIRGNHLLIEKSEVPTERNSASDCANVHLETLSKDYTEPLQSGVSPQESEPVVVKLEASKESTKRASQLLKGDATYLKNTSESSTLEQQNEITPEVYVRSTYTSQLIVQPHRKHSENQSPLSTSQGEKIVMDASDFPVLEEKEKGLEDISFLNADVESDNRADVVGHSESVAEPEVQPPSKTAASEEACKKIEQDPVTESELLTPALNKPVFSEVDVAKSEVVPTISPKPKFSKFKSTYELMKSMDFGQPKKLYNEPDLTIVNYKKLEFLTARLKGIQECSGIAMITSKMSFIPCSATDQFVVKRGLLCKRLDPQKNNVFIVLLKSTAVYREIVSALTEQYPDLDFNEFMSLVDSSFAYTTPDEIKSLVGAIEQKMLSVNYQNFIERCNIVNYDVICTMHYQLRTMQKADCAILNRYNRLLANGGLDDAFILKDDLVCQFVGTMYFKVWLPKSQPDQIAIMYIVHETKHDLDVAKLLEFLRATFEGVNPSLIDRPIALCSICHPPATANASSIVKACEQRCPALRLLPPEVIFKIRQVQMASSVYKAQIDLLTKGQSKQGSRYILDTSLLCKAFPKGTEQVFRVVVSPSGLKEVVSLLHATYHRKPLDEFVSFVNDFLVVNRDVCSAAFQECCICAESKSSKMSGDSLKPQPKRVDAEELRSKPVDTLRSQTMPGDSQKLQSKTIESQKLHSMPIDSPKSQSKPVDIVNALDKERSQPNKADQLKPSVIDPTCKPSGKQLDSGTTSKETKNAEPESSKLAWEVKEKATLPPKTARGEVIRKHIMKDIRANEKIWGRELCDRIKYIVRLVPDRVLADVINNQRSCPELLASIRALERTRPVKDAKEMVCGQILFVLRSKKKPKMAVKQVKHINYLLITNIHREVHDWSINKIQATIAIAFDVSPCKEEVEQTITWFCHRCTKPETGNNVNVHSSLDEQLQDFYKKINPILGKLKEPPKQKAVSPGMTVELTKEPDIFECIIKDLPKLEGIWGGKELGDKIKHVLQPIPVPVLKAVMAAQSECTETMEIMQLLQNSTPVKDARYVVCGGVLFTLKSKKRQMLVKIHVKPIKNINYILITNFHAALHDWTVNRLQTTIGISFDVSPTREEVAVTIEWFCAQCRKPDTSFKKKKTSASLEGHLKDLPDTINPKEHTLLKPKDDDEDDQETTVALTQEVPATDVRDALAKLPSPVVSKIQLAQIQSSVLNTQIKLLENTDVPAQDKGYCLVMSLLCKLVEADGKAVWRVMIPSDMLKELVLELHTVHYHNMVQEDFFDFVNMFMTVPLEMVDEVFSSCALCLTTVRRVPTLCERGIKEDILRKTMAGIAEMLDFIIKWQTECPLLAKIREGVKRCRPDVIVDHLLYKDVLFKLVGKSKGSKGPRPRIAVSLLPNAMEEVIKSTHAFYHSNNPNQLINLINSTFDLTVPKDLLIAKVPEVCNICRKKALAHQVGNADVQSTDVGTSSAVESQSSDTKEKPDRACPDFIPRPVVKEEGNLPVQTQGEEEPTPLGVLLLGRLCDQLIEESSNSSRALDSPVPDFQTSEEMPSVVVRQTCKILLKRCPYDPKIVEENAGKRGPKRKKRAPAKTPARRVKKPKPSPMTPCADSSNESTSESTLPKRKFVTYSSESEPDHTTTTKRKATFPEIEKN